MADEKKGYTEEQVAEIKRRRDERNAATKVIVETLISKREFTGEEISEMRALAVLAAPKSGGRSGSGATRTSVMSIVSGIFDENEEISEDDIFVAHKLGRTEMATATKNIIKKFAPADRKWISFDPETGVYTLAGTGADPPEDWKGYVPVEETLEDEPSDGDEPSDEPEVVEYDENGEEVLVEE